MDIDFNALEQTFRQALEPTSITVRRADDTLVFWKDEERVGLEVAKAEVRALADRYEDETQEQIFNRILRDVYCYLVLKYL